MMKKDVSACLELALQQQGLLKRTIRRMPKMWLSPEEDIQSFFSPHIIKKMDGWQILGVIGINISIFEDIYPTIAELDVASVGEPFLFARYITNFPTLIDPPIFKDPSDLEAIGGWVALIHHEMREMEAHKADVLDAGPYVEAMFPGQYEKKTAFLEWVRAH